MTTEQVKDILQQAADLGCLQVRFTGGEPLLRPDFEELYLYARRLGLKVLLFTNARLITPHLADLFAHIPPLVTIEITVYGMRRESYEAVTRGPGSFAQFWRGVNLLLERNVPFVVKSALLPQNKHEMDEFEAWAKNDSVDDQAARVFDVLRLPQSPRRCKQEPADRVVAPVAGGRACRAGARRGKVPQGDGRVRLEIHGTARRQTVRLRRGTWAVR